MGEMIEFTGNGSPCPGYLARPAAPGPGVVVIQEWWGLVPHIKDVCDRLAAAGFVALAPDLYRGAVTTEPDEAGKLMMSLEFPRATKDMSGAVDWLLADDGTTGDRVGVVGFCMGGGLTLHLAAARPDAVGAAAPFYGLIPWPEAQPDWSAITATVTGNYAGDDGFFTPEAARELATTLQDNGVAADIRIFDGAAHAFFNDTRPEVYDAEASAAAWQRTVDAFAALR